MVHLTRDIEVPFDNEAIERILQSVDSDYNLAGVMYKDSLEMTTDDRKILANIIMQSKDDTFIIVHGTDTMHLSAEFLAEIFDDRIIILVGSMKPFEIDNVEASVNLGMAIGFSKAVNEFGVYICMSGFVKPWQNLQKNKKFGKFEVVQ